MFVKPKQKPDSELNAHWAFVSHHIAKRIVGRSPISRVNFIDFLKVVFKFFSDFLQCLNLKF